MMIIPLVAVLLACGLLTRADDPAAQVLAPPTVPAEGPDTPIYDPHPATTEEPERKC